MTLKNIPITTGFAVITVSQFVLGLCAIIIRLRKGGKVDLLLSAYLSVVTKLVQFKSLCQYPSTRTACAHSVRTEFIILRL